MPFIMRQQRIPHCIIFSIIMHIDWSMSAIFRSPLVQHIFMPRSVFSIVHEHMHIDIMQTGMPFIIIIMPGIMPVPMSHIMCIMPAWAASSQVQVMHMPPSIFFISILARGIMPIMGMFMGIPGIIPGIIMGGIIGIIPPMGIPMPPGIAPMPDIVIGPIADSVILSDFMAPLAISNSSRVSLRGGRIRPPPSESAGDPCKGPRESCQSPTWRSEGAFCVVPGFSAGADVSPGTRHVPPSC
ncbi:MAG: hypothetical protein HY720_16600 [Planctomycetes bacterium]|nr:hypothetical protein [Planctomycetota bacterium]